MKPILEIQSVSKSFRLRHEQNSYLSLRDSLAGIFKKNKSETETFFALDKVSFDVMPGDAIGIIGRNGAGKSTLLKILSKITPPTSGAIKVRGRIASLLEVGTGFHMELTGKENIFFNGSILGMKRAEIKSKFDEIVDFSGTEKFLDTPLKHYSSGMQLRLAFAVAAFLEPEILIIDEVLAVGDAEFQKRCLGKMADVSKSGRTILFVSHNIGALQNLCQKGIVLKNGKVDFEGEIRKSTEHYLHSIFKTSEEKNTKPHILFEQGFVATKKSAMAITQISLHDKNGNPKPIVASGDSFAIRISYESNKHIQRGSVVLEIKTMEGTNLLLLSTQPDSTLPVEIQIGKGCVECIFENFTFASGNFSISAGLAIPNSEWLVWQQDIAVLSISPSDVYGSGLAPISERSLLTANHSWKKIEGVS